MEKVHPEVIQEKSRDVPAEIQIPAYGVGDMCNGIERPAHSIAGKGCKPIWIHFVAEIIEHAMIIQHVGFVFCGNGDLVAHPPADDGRMVVVLNNQLLHLAAGVLPPVRHML